MASISVIIPTLNAADVIGRTLVSMSSLDGLAMIREVIISDGGSSDDIAKIAKEIGADLLVSSPGRGGQLSAGAEASTGDWLLFLHADTALAAGWEEVLGRFMRDQPTKAGYFDFVLDDTGFMPRLVERLVALRCRVFALPYGDQALFISRKLYFEAGGYRSLPLMEDVDFIRRLGRARLFGIDNGAITSASRYKSSGYLKRISRNLFCLTLYFFGVSPERIQRLYEK